MAASSSHVDRQQVFDKAVHDMIASNVPAHHIESLRAAWSHRLDEVASTRLSTKIKTEPYDEVAAAFATVADLSTQSQALSVSSSDTVPWDRQPDVFDDATRLHGDVERAMFQVAMSQADADQLHAQLHADNAAAASVEKELPMPEQARAAAALEDHSVAAQKLHVDNAVAELLAAEKLLAEAAAVAFQRDAEQKLHADNAAAAAAEKHLLDEQARAAAAAALAVQHAAAQKLHADNAAAAAAEKMLLDEQARAAVNKLMNEQAHAAAAAALADQHLQADDALLHLQAHLNQQDAMRKLLAERAAHDVAQVRLQAEATKRLHEAQSATRSRIQQQAIMKLKAETEAFEAEKASYAKKLQDERDSAAAAEKLRIQHDADAKRALSLQLAAAHEKLQYDKAALLLAERAAAAAHDERMRIDQLEKDTAIMKEKAQLEKEKAQLETDTAIMNSLRDATKKLEDDKQALVLARLQFDAEKMLHDDDKHVIKTDAAAAASPHHLMPPRPRSCTRSPAGSHRHSGPAGAPHMEWVCSATHRVLVKYNILHICLFLCFNLCAADMPSSRQGPLVLTPL